MALKASLWLLPLVAVVSSTLPPPPRASADLCSEFSDEERFDCHPEPGNTEEKCLERGCCYSPPARVPQPNVPSCYFPRNYGGYEYINVSSVTDGKVAYLQRTFQSAYPRDVVVLRLEVQEQTKTRLHIKFTDPEKERYETPYPKLTPFQRTTSTIYTDYTYNLDQNKTGIVVQRRSGEVLFSTRDIGGFIYSDQFLQLSSPFFGKIYGLGEHRTNLSLGSNWSRHTMFNRDLVPNENDNLYGSHPFYMVVSEDGRSYGVYLHNSNPMDVLLQPLDAITFRTIGGVLDLYVFTGPTPADVVRQYTELIGLPLMPPYWGLGFHLCRHPYKTTENTRRVWQSVRDAGIPFDVQWNDIDYMIQQNDFTVDPVAYANFTEFVGEVHDAGMHFIPIIDPGISMSESAGTYPPYDDGINMDIFVKAYNGSVFVGKVWNPVGTVWPDFTHPRALEYWLKQIREFYKVVPLDGIWIDMNEPSNFMDGSVDGCPESDLETPQYFTGNKGDKLRGRTLCMTAQQAAGSHYNVHNLYGISMAEVTHLSLRAMGKRPFVISRSTFPGSGVYTGHWSGDNLSSWYDMYKSIQEILTFNMYGIPLVGADICGFRGDTTPALCSRWHQLGAFYPFSRNHNGAGKDQDPVILGDEVVASAKKANTARYTLLPYLYTLFYFAHRNGDTVARPLFFEFPEDKNTLEVDTAFLWGSGLYIIPVLKEGATEVSVYLPAGLWYDWYTGKRITQNIGGQVTLDAPLDTIPLLIRGGTVLPTQAPDVTTTASRKNNFTLIAAADSNGEAKGSLFWDDGDSLDTIGKGSYGLVYFTLWGTYFETLVSSWNTEVAPVVDTIRVLGLPEKIDFLELNFEDVYDFTQDEDNALTVTGVNISLRSKIRLSWTYV